MATQALTARELNRATLARQLLLERAELTAAQAVERLFALQAQEARPPFLGLWSRIAGFEREQLLRALTRRTVVRATAMRATLHLMTARDFAALRGGLAVSIADALKVIGPRAKAIDLDALLPAARKLFGEGPRRFEEIRDDIARRLPDADVRALAYAVRLNVPLVMVPTGDRWGFPQTARFALAEDWLDQPLNADGMPEAFVRRYLAAFGPAAATDVQVFSGRKGIKPVLDGLREELVTFSDERGRELFDLPGAPRPDPDTPAPVRFLPDFDSLLLAHDDRTRVIADPHRKAITTRNLRILATFLVDGVAAGTWRIARSAKQATLTISPFASLPRATKAPLLEEAEALLHFADEEAASYDVVLE